MNELSTTERSVGSRRVNRALRVASWVGATMITAVVGACGGDSTAAPEKPPALNITAHEVPQNFNPFALSTVGLGEANALMFRPLVTLTGDKEVAPALATEWTVSPDAKRITFTLEQGAKWSDGHPLTSADVLWSLGVWLDAKVSAQASRLAGVRGQAEYNAGKAKSIAGLSAPDASTFVVELAEPDASWLDGLTSGVFIYPAHVLSKIPRAKLGSAPFWNKPDVNSGPYKFVRFRRGQFIEFAANPEWTGEKVDFETVFMKILDPSVAVGQLSSGEVHFLDTVAPADAERLKRDPNLVVDSRAGFAPDALHINVESPPLRDPRIRQALIMGLDRDILCEAALRGYCTPQQNNVRLISPTWAIPPDGEIEPLAHDPAKARALLQEAGWKEGTELTVLLLPGNPNWKQVLTLIQAQWRDIGVNMEIRSVSVDVLPDLYSKNRDQWDMFIVGGGNFATEPDSVAPYASCATKYPAGANTSYFCSKELDALWAAGRRTTDQAERAEIYHKAFAIMNEDPSSVILYWPNSTIAYSKHLRGVENIGSQVPYLVGPDKWSWGD